MVNKSLCNATNRQREKSANTAKPPKSHYTDQLVGEVYDPVRSQEPDSEYVKRSPIFDMEKIISPVILFQGLDDKVVPPDVSREVVWLVFGFS